VSKPAATRNSLCDTLVGLGTWYSLHTADPGTTGASEATGGSPAYARKQSTFAAASGGSRAGSLVTFDVASGTYSHWGQWTASSAGTYIDGGALPAPEVFAAQGQYDLTPTITAPA
jgi:hypothetical protein